MDRNVQYGTQEDSGQFCLGQPPHTLQAEEVICRSCGTLAAGALLGIYQVRKYIGEGRSGHAYLATHQRSGQPVVIKLFPADPACTDLWDTARREVRIVTALRHTSILPIFSCTPWYADRSGMMKPLQELMASTPGKDTYLLTLCQYIPGTLTQLIAHYQQQETRQGFYERGAAPITRLLHLIQQVGSAISAAHMRGIVHGAIHPENILVDNQERPWVADFGLAKLHPPAAPYLPPELYSAMSTCTQTGNMAAYWQAINPLTDQYMLAVLCKQLFSQVLQGVDYEHLLPVLHRATHQKAERRYPSIDLFLHELTMQTNHRPAYRSTSELSSGADRASYRYSTPITPIMNKPLAPTTPPLNTPSPSLAEDWEKRGDKLFTLRDYENALKAYHRAVEINPRKATPWLALGDTYLALERYREALMAYDQAMYLNPNDPLAWSNRGTALDALGRHKEAMDSYERAEQLR
jgi:serine/threonine protein kinase